MIRFSLTIFLADLTHATSASGHFKKRAGSVPSLARLANDISERMRASQGNLLEPGCKIRANEFRFFEPTEFGSEQVVLMDCGIHAGLQPCRMPGPKDFDVAAPTEKSRVALHRKFSQRTGVASLEGLRLDCCAVT